MTTAHVNFDAYNDNNNDINKYKNTKTQNININALEIVIKKEQCTEIGCFIQTHNQCKYCRQFKCNNHLKNICIFGPYCIYCHKRKVMIGIGVVLCVLIAIALIFWLLYMIGVY